MSNLNENPNPNPNDIVLAANAKIETYLKDVKNEPDVKKQKKMYRDMMKEVQTDLRKAFSIKTK